MTRFIKLPRQKLSDATPAFACPKVFIGNQIPIYHVLIFFCPEKPCQGILNALASRTIQAVPHTYTIKVHKGFNAARHLEFQLINSRQGAIIKALIAAFEKAGSTDVT